MRLGVLTARGMARVGKMGRRLGEGLRMLESLIPTLQVQVRGCRCRLYRLCRGAGRSTVKGQRVEQTPSIQKPGGKGACDQDCLFVFVLSNKSEPGPQEQILYSPSLLNTRCSACLQDPVT